MAAESMEATANGESSATAIPKTEAQLLQERHEANNQNHHPYVEEALDEEDVEHPAPSLSATAAGKQKASEAPKPSSVLDTKSEEAFPSLGGGPKSSTPAAVPMAWGQKPATVGKAPVNGTSNGTGRGGPMPSTASPRTSTPTAGTSTPASTNVPTGKSSSMNLPGKQSLNLVLLPSEMNGNRIKPVLDEINRKTKCRVEARDYLEGRVIFEATGPTQKDVTDALGKVAAALAKKVC